MIVVSNNKANTYSSVITVVPMTSRIYKKRYLPTHVVINTKTAATLDFSGVAAFLVTN